MTYLIDAWLECAHPKLRVLNKATGEVYLELSESQLARLQEQGLLDVNRLYSVDPLLIQEISHELLEVIAC